MDFENKTKQERARLLNEPADVAVVGGGIAGLFAAYLLALNGKSVHLFEATKRRGGRIRTIRLNAKNEEIPGTVDASETDVIGERRLAISDFNRSKGAHQVGCLRDTMEFHVEFGPMRLELETQYLLDALLTHLGFEPHEAGKPWFADDLEDFPSYVSPQSERDPSYQLDSTETGKGPMQLFELALVRILIRLYFPKPADDRQKTGDDPRAKTREDFELIAEAFKDHEGFDPEQAFKLWRRLEHLTRSVTERSSTGEPLRSSLLKFARDIGVKERWLIQTSAYINDVPLYTLGFWNLVSRYLSHDAMLKVRELGTFYHLLDENPNASEWLTWWLAGLSISDRLKGVAGGMETIVDKLEGTIATALLGAPVRMGNELRVVRLKLNEGHIRVCLNVVDENVAADEARWAGGTYQQVILAIPKLPLESVLLQSLDCFKATKRGDILQWLDSAYGFPLVKTFCVVDNRWWEEESRTNRFATRMPTRELHYWKGHTPRSRQGLIMVYTDRPSSALWSNYVKSGAHTDVTWNNPGEADPFNQRSRLKRKLAHYIRDTDAAEFSAEHIKWVAIRDWGRDPYGGNHAWRPKRKYWLVMKRLGDLPVDRLDQRMTPAIHVCGEAYSDYHGFLEGALRSAVYTISRVLHNDKRLLWLRRLKPRDSRKMKYRRDLEEQGKNGNEIRETLKLDRLRKQRREFEKHRCELRWWVSQLEHGNDEDNIFGLPLKKERQGQS